MYLVCKFEFYQCRSVLEINLCENLSVVSSDTLMFSGYVGVLRLCWHSLGTSLFSRYIGVLRVLLVSFLYVGVLHWKTNSQERYFNKVPLNTTWLIIVIITYSSLNLLFRIIKKYWQVVELSGLKQVPWADHILISSYPWIRIIRAQNSLVPLYWI